MGQQVLCRALQDAEWRRTGPLTSVLLWGLSGHFSGQGNSGELEVVDCA